MKSQLTNHLFLRIVAIILLLVTIGTVAFPQASRFKQEEFILGTFWDPPYAFADRSIENDSVSFALAKEAHFNLLTGTQAAGSIDRTYEGMVWALDISKRVGLKYLITDQRYYQAFNNVFHPDRAHEISEDYHRLNDRLRSAMYGYNLGDEPEYLQDHKENLSKWKSFFEKVDSTKLSYYNLVASYAVDQGWGGFKSGNQDGYLSENERREYESYLAAYIDSLRPSVISFDHYPFFKHERIRRDYFYNLDIIRRKAGTRPFWAHPMTTGHLNYADPTESQLRFMYFCPIAYGAKGLIDFTFSPPPYQGYRSSLVEHSKKRTSNFDVIRTLNIFVTRILSPVVMNTKHIGVYHSSDYPGNQQYVGSEFNTDNGRIAAVGERRIMIGVFESGDALYLFVVNKHLKTLRDVKIDIRGLASSIVSAPRVINFSSTTQLTYSVIKSERDFKRGTTRFNIPEMLGGEGRLVKVTGDGRGL